MSLLHWTEQGIKNYKDTLSRVEDASKLAESFGGRLREVLYMVGEYDLVAISEYPDDETATAALLQIGFSAVSARTRCGASPLTR